MRTRNLKPNFFKNDILGSLNPLARLLFSGLWCLADREGRLEDRPLRIKAEILPFDDCDVDSLLSLLHENGFITRYEAEGKKYIDIPRFTYHQHPNMKEAASEIPPPNPDKKAVLSKAPDKHCESLVKAPAKHRESSPLNLKPQTLNPKPQTLNPKTESGDADAILDHFEKVTHLRFRDRETPKALITKTLEKGFKPDELKSVTEKLNSEWKDTKYSYLLTPSYIFGDKFEELLLRKSAGEKDKPKGRFTSMESRDYTEDDLSSFYNSAL